MLMNTFPALARPTYSIDESEPDRLVRMKVEGFFDRATLIQHFSDNAAFVNRWRAAGQPIRVLIDALKLQPHTPENQAIVMQSFERIYLPGDRVAIMVESSLVKMQMRRTHTYGDIIGFFVSESAALKWMLAHDG
jgi:hypothetical protein